MISGEPAAAGSILEVEDGKAWTLLRLGKAVEHQAEAAAPEVAAEEALQRGGTKAQNHSQED